jgi:hypothetical protein
MRASAAAGQPDGDAHEIATYNDFSSGQTAVSSISALICDSALTTTTSAAAPTTPTHPGRPQTYHPTPPPPLPGRRQTLNRTSPPPIPYPPPVQRTPPPPP